MLGGASWGHGIEIGDGVTVQIDQRSRFADGTDLADKASISDSCVRGELSMSEGATVAGGKGSLSILGDGVAIGAGASLDAAIHVWDGVEVGEPAQLEGPTRRNPEGLPTELDADCEVLDRARIQPGARLGKRTRFGSSTEVGTQVVTGTDRDREPCRCRRLSRLNGSMISDGARIGHRVETGQASHVGEGAVVEDNAVIEPYTRVEDDGYVLRVTVICESEV